MIGTANNIAIALLTNAQGSDEQIVCAVWRKEDIRHVTGEWALNKEEISTVLERLDAELEYGANTALIQSIAEGVREEQRENRMVTVPAASLETVIQLAVREMERIALCAVDGGGDVEETLRDENAVMRTLRQALDQ